MKLSILLLFGGESSEHEVSLMSARNVYDALDVDKYVVALCYITRDGQWRLARSIDDTDSSQSLTPNFGQKSFKVSDGTTLSVDVVYPVLHGKHGEDGEMQGLASLLHIPFVGPNLYGAALTMDKDLTKRLLRYSNIPVVDWICWRVGEPRPDYSAISKKLGNVLFVKPGRAGSTIGVSKVRTAEELENALDLAAKHDEYVLIERAIMGREIEVAVLGNNAAKATQPGEILPGKEFYSYDDKYATDSSATTKIPADVEQTVAHDLRCYALDAYALTRGQGMARVDFFVTDHNKIYLNEINSLPGFTNISMYPKLWQHEGITYTELIDRLISHALEV